jgi:hypothetical protein
VVSVLATGPKNCGFKPNQGSGFLRVIIKVFSTPSVGSKAGVPCYKILQHVKNPLRYFKY